MEKVIRNMSEIVTLNILHFNINIAVLTNAFLSCE